jgi:hypothetical protein
MLRAFKVEVHRIRDHIVVLKKAVLLFTIPTGPGQAASPPPPPQMGLNCITMSCYFQCSLLLLEVTEP